MKVESLGRIEQVMVRWICGLPLKDGKQSVEFYNPLGIQCVADVVRHGRLKWFGHLWHSSEDD